MSWLKRKETLESRRTAYAKINPGDNVYRFFEFTHTVKPVDIELGRYDASETKVGTSTKEGFAIIRKHFKPQFAMCGKVRSMTTGTLLGDCEYCDKVDEILDDVNASEQDKAVANRWLGNDQYAFVVVDVNEKPPVYRTLELSRSQGMGILELQQFAEKKGRTVFGLSGKDICIRYDKTNKNPKDRYRIIEIDTTECVDLKKVALPGDIPDLFADANMVPPEWQALVREQNGTGTSSPAPTPEPAAAAKTTTKAPAKVKSAKPKPAPAEVPWPPVVGQQVTVLFDADDKQVGTVTALEDEAGAGLFNVDINGEGFQCTLEEMEKVS